MSGKRIVSIVLIVVMMLSTASFAAIEKDNEALEPAYTIYLEVRPNLSFQDDIANCKLVLRSSATYADRAVVRIVLEKQNGTSYSVVKTWRDQAMSFNAEGVGNIVRSHIVDESGNYRIRVSGTIYKNNQVVESFSDKVSNVVSN